MLRNLSVLLLGVMMSAAQGGDSLFGASGDLKTGTPGSATMQAGGAAQTVTQGQMQEAVQRILDQAIASGAQTAAQCCVYLDGKLVVDAWAGSYEKNGERKIDGDSLFPVFSTEKPLLVTAVHRAVELGKMDYDRKIAEVWPEFACNGKENITLRNVISHRTGLPAGPQGGTTPENLCNWDYMVRQCASTKPTLTPGTTAGYLSTTYGWFLGEPLSRAMEKPIRDALRELVLIPAGIDQQFYFGIDDEALARCVTVYNGIEKYGFESQNQTIRRKACIPSISAMASARGIAKFYVRLTGMDGQPPLLSPQTLENALQPCRWEKEPVPEDVNQKWQTVWGLGYGLWGEKNEISRVFGQGGVGGSEGLCDRKQRMVIAYTCAVSATSCGQPYDLRPAIFRTVGFKTRYSK